MFDALVLVAEGGAVVAQVPEALPADVDAAQLAALCAA